jgi:hypothetical protein
VLLAKLWAELQGELGELLGRRSAPEGKEDVLDEEIENKRRELELVEATEEQLAAQEGGQRAIEGNGPGASTEVRY